MNLKELMKKIRDIPSILFTSGSEEVQHDVARDLGKSDPKNGLDLIEKNKRRTDTSADNADI